MSNEKLKEAIDKTAGYIDWMACGPAKYRSRIDNLRTVLAAARAYACERCEDGEVLKDIEEFNQDPTSCWKDCPDCAKWRRIADGGEG